MNDKSSERKQNAGLAKGQRAIHLEKRLIRPNIKHADQWANYQ